ncbi:MAG: FAD-dependent oxidoreductase [Cyanobacteria bacterium P01_H01_bin.15]
MLLTLRRTLCSLSLSLISVQLLPPAQAAPDTDHVETCDLLIAGGGLAGTGAAYEALLAGATVCMTEITDWVGGQISAQGTSALDERATQRSELFFPRGYLTFREGIEDFYDELNPGDCWVSASCFLPRDAHTVMLKQLQEAEKKGKGELKWFPNTVIKELEYAESPGEGSTIITRAIAIRHEPKDGAPPLNTLPLSQTIEDAFTYEDSDLFTKDIIRFEPKPENLKNATRAPWFVIDATETGELIGLTNIPYRLGIDPRSYLEPSSSSVSGDQYCTQGFTYTFAMEQTAEPQPQPEPDFYQQYAPYFSYELDRLASFDLVFTYRRIWSPETGPQDQFRGIVFSSPTPGDISMQNWTWGNDYRPGTSQDNLIYTREQLQADGQLAPGGWLGGLRTETLQRGEEHALAYYHWLVAGTTDSQLGDGVKEPEPNHRYVSGLESPMGTVHGLSKYPYMREGRRIIGRPFRGYPDGFTVWELDMSRRDYEDDFYKEALDPDTYRRMRATLAGLEGVQIINGEVAPDAIARRTRSTIFPDAVGIGHYAIDFHPCMTESPPEKPGNTEREGERRGAGQAYPFQIPLRALIPQEIDNLLIAGKSIAVSHIAAAAYRVHSFEWSSGVAAGMAAVFSLEKDIFPYEMVDGVFFAEKDLQELKRRLNESGNPTAFPDTSIFNEDWDEWR